MEVTRVRRQARFVALAAVACPVACVLCMNTLAPGPSSARASVSGGKSTNAQKLVLPDDSWVRGLANERQSAPIDGSPFPEVVVSSVPLPEAVIATAPERVDPEPAIRLTGIMRSVAGDVALIGGKMLRAGSDVDGPWRVEAIDAAARTVTIRHGTDGRSFVVTLDRE
ncbi:MAG: hypothetical protein KIT19_00740 [Phycisphaeraceae bacterium]|nr:hypothetical protein [Phycisphaeraceae bacterium]